MNRLVKTVSNAGNVPSLRLRTLFECLLREIDWERESLTGVICDQVPDERGDRVPGLRAVRLRPMLHEAGRPLLYLDGTADEEMAKTLFGSDLACHHYPVERHAHVTQVTGCNFSKRRILNLGPRGAPATGKIADENQKLVERLRSVLDHHADAAIFATKAIIEALDLKDSPRAGHFGALRGRNTWEKHDSVIIIGREQPAPRGVETIARAYAAAAGEAFQSCDYTMETRGIRMSEDCVPLEVYCHPDPWGDRILRQIREAEIEQAIDRIRLIHNDEPKSVFLLSPVVVDITVDRVMDWRDFHQGGNRIERAIAEHQVLLLSPRDCARHMPHIWSNAQTAARDLRAMQMSQHPYMTIYGECDGKSRHLVEFRIREKDGRRSRWKEALVFAGNHRTREVLEAVVGPVEEYKVAE